MISILDYDVGNLGSVKKAFEYNLNKNNLLEEIVVTRDKKKLENSSAIILPGVGAFGEAIKNLEKFDLIDILKYLILEKQILCFGICLGFQLFFKKSYEFGEFNGLEFFPEELIEFDINKGKVPHMGWNNVYFNRDNLIFSDIKNGSYFYFVHSFFVKDNFSYKYDNIEIFYSEYINEKFISGIHYKNIFGFQFHPEKSQILGLKLIENFINLIKK